MVGKAGRVGPRPTQLEVDPRYVDKYAEALRSGGKVDPIDLVELRDGCQFITEGHHRYVASRRTGIPVDTRVIVPARAQRRC